MPKLTLEEKRRETLRRQLYGKEDASIKLPQKYSTGSKVQSSRTYSLSDHQTSTSHTELISTNFLSKDLTRILTISTIAIGIQISLFFLLQKNLVSLPF